MTLLERIRKAEGCSRDDDPTAPPRKPAEPQWRRYVREHRIARAEWGKAA